MAGIAIGALCGLGPSSSMLLGKGGKNLERSSSACSLWSTVTVPSVLTSCGTFPNAASSPTFRYLAAFQMLLLSARNSFQCFFFCCRIALWYCLDAPFAISSRSGLVRPARLSDRAQFLQYVCQVGRPPSLCVRRRPGLGC